MSLWHWHELLEACGLIDSTEGPDIFGVCIDSRLIKAGDLFVALAGDPGPRFFSSSASSRDGHDFIASAVEKGAAALLPSKPVLSKPAEAATPIGVPGIVTLIGIFETSTEAELSPALLTAVTT